CLFGDQQSGYNKALIASHSAFTTDNLGNMYLVQDEELFKYAPDNKLLGRYSNLRLGNISNVDATNPLKILVYYNDYQQLVFLDNQLSPHNRVISLQELGLEQASLVCAGANNSFWIFDRRNCELLRFDQNGRRIAATGNLRQILNAEIRPSSMREQNNNLYLVCPSSGIYVFDIFGAFSKLLPIGQVESLQVDGNILYYYRNRKLCSYDQKFFSEKCDTIHAVGVLSVQVQGSKRYVSFGDSLLVSPL